MPIVNNTRDLTIVAHQDDDLLFMNPDIQEGITAGRETTTIYVTAGDAGQAAPYWQGRETGIKAAYATMAGASDWVDEVVSLTHGGTTYQIQSSYLASEPQVRLYFLRLPDGGEDGWPLYNFESLAQLNDGRISQISTVDGSATYSRAQVVGLLEGLLERHQPDQIRVQDHESDFAGGEHRDHVHSSIYSEEAIDGYSASQYTVTSYVHYGTADLRANLDAVTAAQTLQTFLDYAAFDANVFESNGSLISLYAAWAGRQFIASEYTVAPASTTSITGQYFFENSNQGLQGAGDGVVSGASVYLYDDSSAQIIATARTDLTGLYQFHDVPVDPGYRILFQDPQTLGGAFASFGFSTANQGNDDTIDSDVTALLAGGAGATDLFALTAGQTISDIDAAIYNANPSSLSGRYFVDGNGDGIRAITDTGIDGASVTLINSATNDVVATTTTGADGSYTFTAVVPGFTYTIHFEAPETLGSAYSNHAFTTANAGTDDGIDSDVTGLLPNGTGIAPLAALQIGQSLTDIDAGLQIPTTASISGRYFVDSNQNGLEDLTEAGINGAQVYLYNTATYSVAATTTTDTNGAYRFDDVTPSDSYTVRFDYGNALAAGFEFHRYTTGNAGSDDTIDSDVSRLTYTGLGETAAFSVGTAQTITHVDAGLRPPSLASVSGRYFFDHNDNGLDDGGPGLANATVTLMQGDTEIAITNTRADGTYRFDDLSYGDDYFVIFENAEFVADTPANGFTDLVQVDGFFNGLDSHVTREMPFCSGGTDAFSLSPGQDLININAGASQFLAPWADDGMLTG